MGKSRWIIKSGGLNPQPFKVNPDDYLITIGLSGATKILRLRQKTVRSENLKSFESKVVMGVQWKLSRLGGPRSLLTCQLVDL